MSDLIICDGCLKKFPKEKLIEITLDEYHTNHKRWWCTRCQRRYLGFDSLDEHNAKEMRKHRNYEEWLKNPTAGVFCDKCEKEGIRSEMVYENPEWDNASYPPTKWVVCPKCGFKGLKY